MSKGFILSIYLETKNALLRLLQTPIKVFSFFSSRSGINTRVDPPIRTTSASVIAVNPPALPISPPASTIMGVLPPPTPPKGYADHPHHHIPPSPDLPPLPPLPPGASENEETHPLMTNTLDVASLQSQNSQNLQNLQFASMDSPRDVIGATSRIPPQQLNLRKEPLYTITSVSGNGPTMSSMMASKPSGKNSTANNTDAPHSEISV